MAKYDLTGDILERTGEELMRSRLRREVYSDRKRLAFAIKHAYNHELTKKQKQVVRMHYFENMSVSEIAKRIGSCKSSVSRLLGRATQRITYAAYYLYYNS
jgi:RNA polymerase sigma factor (sigma-70 family)